MLIYMHTSKTSGKSYIGFTSNTIEDRLKGHLKAVEKGYNLTFHNAIRKHGIDDFASRILENNILDIKLCKEREIYWIAHYDTCSNGYNMTKGGDGGDTLSKHPNEKDIRCNIELGRKKWYDNLSEEEYIQWCKNISNNRIGNFREGYVPTEEHRKKSSDSNKLFWEKLTEEEKELKRLINSTHNAKRVIIGGVEYESMKKAATLLNTTSYAIKQIVKEQNAK